MIPPRLRAALRQERTLVMCLLALSALVSLSLGQDANWDLQNYHLYGPFALLNGRYALDLQAAGIQTFYNPLIDVPYYLLAMDIMPGWPRVVQALAGLPYGLLIWLTVCIARRVLPLAWGQRRWPVVIATLIGATGTATWSEVGTTFGDIPLAVLVLTGCLLLLRVVGGTRRPLLTCLAAGLVLGAACGLKPTVLVFAVPAALALAVALLPAAGRMLASLAAFGVGGVVASAVFYGWWGWRLFVAYGNPIPPYMNQIFRSPWFLPEAGTDPRFKPHGWLQTIFYPFEWARGGQNLVAEITYRDARFAVAWIAVVLLLGTAAALVLRPRLRRHMTFSYVLLAAPATRFLLVFCVLSFALWEVGFAIIRYAVSLEALVGVVILLGLRVAAELWTEVASARGFRGGSRVPAVGVASVLAVGLVLSANYGNWGRIGRPGARVFTIPVHELAADSLVLIAGKPRAFLAPFLTGPGVAFIGVEDMSGGTRMWDAAKARVAGHQGPIFILGRNDDPLWTPASALAGLGVRPTGDGCAPLDNPLQRNLILCPAAHYPSP